MVAAHAAANVVEPRETSGLQATLWKLDGLVDRASEYTKYLLYVGGGGAALTLVFLLMQMMGGKTTPVQVGVGQWGNINMAAGAFGWLLAIAAVGGLVAIWEQKGAGIAMAVIGIGIFFGLPWLLAYQFGVYDAEKNRSIASFASTQLAAGCRIGGMGVAIVGLLKWMLEVLTWLIEMPDRMMKKANVGAGQQIDAAQQRVAREANAFSPCWSLPFCREVIRKQCPAYLARKTCWKFKRGCYCDDEMIARIVRGESLEKIKAPTRMSQLRKPPCGRCYIYLDHQSHKFRLLSPVAFPLTIILMVVIWGPFGEVFRPAYRWLDDKQKNLKFLQTPNPVGADAASQEEAKKIGAVDEDQAIAFTQWFIGLIGGFLALIYISKSIEWIVFQAKL